jgi:hypothetical protein
MLKTKLLAGLSLAIALAVPASSQFLMRVDQNGQSSTLANGGTLALNSPAVGQAVSATVTLTYIGASAATFSTAPQVFGSGAFTVSNPGSVTLSPTQSTSLTFQFTPSQTAASQSVFNWLFQEKGSANYEVITLSLSGTVAGITVSSVQSNGNYAGVPSGGSLSFPDTRIDTSSDITIAITNRGSGTGTVNSIAVSGDAYQLLGLPLLPVTLPAGAELRVTVRFLPKSVGVQTGSLQISSDAGPYSAALQGTAISLDFGFEFTGASGVQAPFSQPAIGLSLTAPYAVDLQGTLTLSTATDTFAADPAVQFSSGGTKVPFTIPAGTLAAVFPSGSTQVMIQTGTVAEFIVITPSFATSSGTDLTPASPTTLKIEIPRLAPSLLEASIGSITSTGFTVNITGFSTTRTLDQLSIQFKGAPGVSISAAATTIDVNTAATFWFASSTSQALGGLFSIDIPFTISVSGSGSSPSSGLAAFIAGLSITASNEVGTSNQLQVSLP